jgi:hypothetical protein
MQRSPEKLEHGAVVVHYKDVFHAI